jgi:hypothetical protein
MNKISIKTLKEVENQFSDFQIGQVQGGNNSVYLKFGYWKKVDTTKLQEVLGNSANVVEDSDFDDDCGWQYSYKLK